MIVLLTGIVALLANPSIVTEGDDRLAFILVGLGVLVAVNLGHILSAFHFSTLRRPSRALTLAFLNWMILAVVMVLVVKLADVGNTNDQLWAAEWLAAALVLLLVSRLAIGLLVMRWTRAGRLTRHAAILGAGAVAERIIQYLGTLPDRSLAVNGIYDDRHQRFNDHQTSAPIRGSSDDLLADIRRRRVDTVIVALPMAADHRLTQVVEKLRQTPVTVMLCPEWFDMRAGACPVKQIDGIPLLQALDSPLRDWRGIAKMVEDRVLAAIILLLISPILAAIAIAIKIDSPGPALFRQKRYGFNNELIEVFKFRSMHHHTRDLNGEQLTRRNDPRITRVGAFIRRTSLDELPQFLNVLRGEMSIVGPRPHAMAAKAGGVLYPDAVRFYHARHRMKPGITGWAQVNGWRGETETVDQITKRVEHDLYYVDHWSVVFDLWIIIRTVLGGFTGRHAF